MLVNTEYCSIPCKWICANYMAIIFGILFVPYFAFAQLPTEKKPVDAAAIDSLRKLAAANPDSLSYHQRFIKAFGINKEELAVQYDTWIQQFPASFIVPYAIGEGYAEAESPKAKPYLLKAVALNPSYAKAWYQLSFDADRWGDKDASREYMGKASKAAPDDPGYAFYYAMDFEHTDPAKWRSLLYDLAKRFPDNERGAQGLYWLGVRSTDAKEKISALEQLRQLYPPQKFRWSAGGMSWLFDLYITLQSAPDKAAALALTMGNDNGWPEKVKLARSIIAVEKFIADKQFGLALQVLDSVKVSPYSTTRNLVALLKASVLDASGNTRAAYDSLIVLLAKSPGDALQTAVEKYGLKIGKSINQIKDDLWQIREKDSRPAPDFELGLYTSDKRVSLKDFSGKVILLTFWFPGCGPCRGEFPHFENVLKNFNKNEVVYVGINVLPGQDAYVLPFMQGTGYSFIPLRGNEAWAKDTYKVRGEPTNFLIDQKGKILFTNFRADDPLSERSLELMIRSILQREKQQQS